MQCAWREKKPIASRKINIFKKRIFPSKIPFSAENCCMWLTIKLKRKNRYRCKKCLNEGKSFCHTIFVRRIAKSSRCKVCGLAICKVSQNRGRPGKKFTGRKIKKCQVSGSTYTQRRIFTGGKAHERGRGPIDMQEVEQRERKNERQRGTFASFWGNGKIKKNPNLFER